MLMAINSSRRGTPSNGIGNPRPVRLPQHPLTHINKPAPWPAYVVTGCRVAMRAMRKADLVRTPEGHPMSAIAKTVEINAASSKSLEEAIQSGLRKVAGTIDNVQGAWVSDIKVRTAPNGDITEWRACLRVTFIVD